ncbi:MULTISPECIES: DUF3883 domain-containing protein [unclassified Sphingomonas]|uniref:DUF3883 domain-containing protein n=1 Tax=unclassified Sphingomonas TaxID=196159 RepID=UPI0006FCC740|nr:MULTISPECIES: DUF3883 domain-containing protein [unclassified Sphingomonas]KQX22765.1 hypothetical protein ASD17_05655 [Sphingomonas sp. Root1294]KQY67757.1 hypothetical protein ASD39_07470 [Sphingomonas sp. Root50]
MVATERLFTPSAFEGLRLIRRTLIENPEMTIADIVTSILATEPDAPSLDLDASCELHDIVVICDLERQNFYRHCIRGVILARFPVWVKTIRRGRLVFAAKLEVDDFSIFDNAGLLINPPPPDVVEWWDTIGHEVKLETDLEKMAQARAAEKLTWEAEKARLLGLGIDTDPVWVGLDDNTAGYDILSYDPGEPENTNKLIEVKSTTASPLRFYVTRNEWNQALKSKDAYFFHIWDMQQDPPKLYLRTVDQIEPHIPSDNEKGKWSNAEIPVGGA